MSGKAVSNTPAGPYWVRTNTNGTHDVCGRHGKTVRQYRADMVAAANADCRKLQAGHAKSAKQLTDAAPDLLEACISARMQLRVAVIAHSGGLYDHENVGEHIGVAKLDAAIAKATGA
jgi:hypothetical protein